MPIPVPIVDTLLNMGKSIIERVFPDPADQARELRKLEEMAQAERFEELRAHVTLLTGQLEINKEEAKSGNVFVAGWRPFVGWVCGVSLLYVAILEPIARFVATMRGYTGDFPVIDTTITMQVLIGMLGLGVYRTYEKGQKTDTKQVK